MAAICKFVINNSLETLTPYFWEMPENFRVPAIYFPVPETNNDKVTLNMVKTHLTWRTRIYASDDLQAYGIASDIQSKLLLQNNKIPLYDHDGTLIERPLNIGFPFLKKIGTGIQQMEISYKKFTGLLVSNEPKVAEVNFVGLDYLESPEIQEVYQEAVNKILKEGKDETR